MARFISPSSSGNSLINSVLDKVADLYNSYGECGNRCNHPSGECNDDFSRKTDCQNCGHNSVFDDDRHCKGCCLECSEEIHWRRSLRGTHFRALYNCQKLAYYYACRYSWKYCSEMIYALECIDLSKYSEYTVLSIGCGASPDLMALEQRNRTDHKTILYTGYDINTYWSSIHSEISNYSHQTANISCKYGIGDVFETLQNGIGGFANIIVLSYFLSSLSDSDRPEKAAILFDLIIRKILSCKNDEPVLIIINDIDHDEKVRKYFSILLGKVKQAGYHANIQKYHFGDRKGKDYGDGSKRHASCANKFVIPNDICGKFHCAIQCNSAQCIIEVN